MVVGGGGESLGDMSPKKLIFFLLTPSLKVELEYSFFFYKHK